MINSGPTALSNFEWPIEVATTVENSNAFNRILAELNLKTTRTLLLELEVELDSGLQP